MTPSDNPTSRLHLRVAPTAEWKLRSGHPWLYADSILEQNREGRLGELAVIYDRHDNFLAIGLFDPGSPIRVRNLLVGKPQRIDSKWWRARFSATLQQREGMFDAQTTGYRLIHGESDGWPGLVLDRYDTTLVLKLYTAAWLPWMSEIQVLLNSSTSSALPRPLDGAGEDRGVVLRLSRNIQALAAKEFQLSDGQVLQGPAVDGPVIFLESGLRFEADVVHGQKTGFFLDQRENRRLVESFAKGRVVLNAFSFSGGFSLYAARGGAEAVTDLDISAHALESARRNFALNQSTAAVASCRHELVRGDAFKWLRTNASPAFDLIILDPPSLAKREVERVGAIEAYGRLVSQALACLRRGGVLVAASCSAHVSVVEFFGAVREAVRRSGRKFEELQTTGHPLDHPAGFAEAQYLKSIYLRC